MKNRICDMFGIEFPIVAFTHCRDVVVAVSKVGGLGVLGAAGHSPEGLEIDLDWIEAETQGKPYGVDLVIPLNYVGKDEGGLAKTEERALLPSEQQNFVAGLMDRYGVPDLPARPDRPSTTGVSITANRTQPLLEIALAHDISLIANALGPPTPEMVRINIRHRPLAEPDR